MAFNRTTLNELATVCTAAVLSWLIFIGGPLAATCWVAHKLAEHQKPLNPKTKALAEACEGITYNHFRSKRAPAAPASKPIALAKWVCKINVASQPGTTAPRAILRAMRVTFILPVHLATLSLSHDF